MPRLASLASSSLLNIRVISEVFGPVDFNAASVYLDYTNQEFYVGFALEDDAINFATTLDYYTDSVVLLNGEFTTDLGAPLGVQTYTLTVSNITSALTVASGFPDWNVGPIPAAFADPGDPNVYANGGAGIQSNYNTRTRSEHGATCEWSNQFGTVGSFNFTTEAYWRDLDYWIARQGSTAFGARHGVIKITVINDSSEYWATVTQSPDNSFWSGTSGLIDWSNSGDIVYYPTPPSYSNESVQLNWYDVRLPAWSGTGVVSYDYDSQFGGTSSIGFTGNSAADNFLTELQLVALRRSTATLVTYDPMEVFVYPTSGLYEEARVSVDNSQASGAITANGFVSFTHVLVNSTTGFSTGGSGNWNISSPGVYNSANEFEYSYVDGTGGAPGTVTVTISTSLASQLADELQNCRGNGSTTLSVNGLLGGVETYITFFSVTNIQGTGTQLTFNYQVKSVIGSFVTGTSFIQG